MKNNPNRYMDLPRIQTAISETRFSHSKAAADGRLAKEAELDDVRAALAELPDEVPDVELPPTGQRVGHCVLGGLLTGIVFLLPTNVAAGALAWLGASALLATLEIGSRGATLAQRGLGRRAPSLAPVVTGTFVAAGAGGLAALLTSTGVDALPRALAAALTLGLAVGWLTWTYHQARVNWHQAARARAERRRLEAHRGRVESAIERMEAAQEAVYHGPGGRNVGYLEALGRAQATSTAKVVDSDETDEPGEPPIRH